MEKFLLFISAATALFAIPPIAECLHYFVYEPKTWSEARSYCQEKFTDMATVSNMEDVETLNNMADLSKMLESDGKKLAWIGLQKVVTDWSWSDRDFYEDDETKFRNWRNGEPNDHRGNEDCACMPQDGGWNDFICGSSLKSICYERVSGSPVKFFFMEKERNFLEAQRVCRQKHTDLVSISSQSDNTELTQLIPPNTTVWIGLFRGSWATLNGSKSTFRYWSDWQPNEEEENCAAANFANSGRWEDSSCDTRMPFICYDDAPVLKQVVKLKLKLASSSSLDLQDPAVLEDMLKKLEQKLKERGASGDFRLSWRKQPDGTVFQKEEAE